MGQAGPVLRHVALIPVVIFGLLFYFARHQIGR